MEQIKRYNLDESNEPMSKQGFKMVGFLVMLSVFLMLVYFGIKAEKKYPYPNDEYVFLIENPDFSFYKTETLGFNEKVAGWLNMLKITAYQKQTTFEYKSISVRTNDGFAMELDIRVKADLTDVKDEELLFFTNDNEESKLENLVETVCWQAARNSAALISLKDIIRNRSESINSMRKLIQNQLKDGIFELEIIDTCNIHILSIKHDINNKPIRNKIPMFKSASLVLQNITVHFDESTLKKIANLKLVQQMLAEVKAHKNEIMANATPKEKKELEMYFTMKEIEIQHAIQNTKRYGK